MTDLRQAAEMALKAFEVATTHFARDRQEILAAMQALRQALADTGTDRGAWSDVPDATKWVDELRGGDVEWDDKPPHWSDEIRDELTALFDKDGFEDGNGSELIYLDDALKIVDEVDAKLNRKAEPTKPDLLNQTCCECGKSGGYALYCGDCWSKASKWVGLTDEEIEKEHYFPFYYRKFARAIEAKLREKNSG